MSEEILGFGSDTQAAPSSPRVLAIKIEYQKLKFFERDKYEDPFFRIRTHAIGLHAYLADGSRYKSTDQLYQDKWQELVEYCDEIFGDKTYMGLNLYRLNSDFYRIEFLRKRDAMLCKLQFS